MRLARLFVFLLLFLSLSNVSLAVDVGDVAPEWSLETVQGKSVEFPADVKGQASILFFWASWCPYCHIVMPYLDQIKKDYAKYGVEIYAINFKDGADPASYMEEHGYDFMVLPVGDLVAEDYDIWSSPGLLVVDEKNLVQYRRRKTKAPPDKKIAEVWDEQVRTVLNRVLQK